MRSVCVAENVLIRLAFARRQNGDFMTSIRRYICAALLVTATLCYAPSRAAAQQPARGTFTLTHEVHFGAARIPAGDYKFSYDPEGTTPVLNLSKMNGPRAAFMVLVPVVEDSRLSEESKLLLESTPAGSYVNALQLPQCGMTLRFAVPSHFSEKQVAKAVTTASAGQ
jgi:hypothetical protein